MASDSIFSFRQKESDSLLVVTKSAKGRFLYVFDHLGYDSEEDNELLHKRWRGKIPDEFEFPEDEHGDKQTGNVLQEASNNAQADYDISMSLYNWLGDRSFVIASEGPELRVLLNERSS
jgi:hypothetical protein